MGMSLTQMQKAAADAGFGDVHFDWEAARSVEGYYRIKGSTDFCIQRAIAWTPYADAIWMETGKPIYSQAQKFASEVRAAAPHQMLAYNNSPSFNRDSSGMSDKEMETFIWDLAKAYKTQGMAAYVQLIQREERKHGVETLTHQKWSGSELVDEAGNVITSGTSSTGIMSAGVTETQFNKH